MKFLLRTICLIVLLLTVIPLVGFYTERGSSAVLNAAELLLPLEIEYGSGSLSGRLTLHRLEYTTESMRLQLDNALVQLDSRCFWRSAFCFAELEAGHLDIELLSGPPQEESRQDRMVSKATQEKLVFPVQLEADSLALASLRVRWRGGEWRQGSLRAAVHVAESAVTVRRAAIMEPLLTLSDSRGAAVPATGPMAMPRIDLPLSLLVEHLELIRPSWNFYGSGFQQDRIFLAGSWLNTRLQLSRLDAQSADLGELSLRGALEFSGNWPLQVQTDLTASRALPFPWLSLLGREVSVSAEGDLETLDLELIGSGRIDTAVLAQINVLSAGLPFSATLTSLSAERLVFADTDGAPESLSGLELEFPLAASVSGTLTEQQFELQGLFSGWGYQGMQISLRGRREPERNTIADLSLQDIGGVNALVGSGEVAVSEQVEWSAALQTEGFALPLLDRFPPGRIAGKAKLSGAMRSDFWNVSLDDVELQGEINELPARITGFAVVDSSMRLSATALEAGLNGAALSVYFPGDAQGHGRLQLTVDDIGRWQPGSRGRLHLEAEVSGDQQYFEFHGNFHDIEGEGFGVESGSMSGNFRMDTDHPFNLESQLHRVKIGNIALDSLGLSAQGDALRQSMTLASSGDIQGKLAVSGAAQDDHWRGALAAMSLQTPLGLWRLTDAVTLDWSPEKQQLTLAGHCWRHETAQLCAGDWVVGRQGRGSAELEGDLKALSTLLPVGLDMTGDLQVRLETSWSPDQGLTAQASSVARDIVLAQQLEAGESASFTWDGVNISAQYTRAGGLLTEWSLEHAGHKVVSAELQLPQSREEPMSGSLFVDRLQLGVFAPFMPEFSVLQGEVNGRLSFAGSAAQPLVRGALNLSQGHLVLLNNPTELESLDLSLDFQGARAQVNGSGTLGGGELNISGLLDVQPHFQLELAVEGEKHTILYPPSTELLVSENLRVVLGRNLLEVSGDVVLLEGLLEFEQLPEDSVSMSTSIVEVDSAGNVIEEKRPFDTKIDVRIKIEDQFKVVGSAVRTTLGGELRTRQQPGKPMQLFGSLRTIEGELRAYQTLLQIRRGTLNFTGPPENPVVHVRAERRISADNVTVGVDIQGPLAEDLQLEVYSNPSMSQGDAMSYLVQGSPINSGSDTDGSAMALSMAGSALLNSSLGSSLNSVEGVSNVEFGAQGSDKETAATVSGYFGEKIYLSYGIGLYEPVDVLTARFYLATRLWVEVVSSLMNSADLYYSFDID